MVLKILLQYFKVINSIFYFADGEKMTKMKKLLDVLSNPDTRIPLGTLLKCEAALEAQLGSFKEQTVNVRFLAT